MVYTGDRRARKPNRSWWNKPEINNMTEAVTSLGCRDQGKRWRDWCPGGPGLPGRRWSLREDAATGSKNEWPCFLPFSLLLLCPQPPHVRPSQMSADKGAWEIGKGQKKKKKGIERQMSQTATSSSCFAYTSFLLTSEYVFSHLSFLLVNLGKKVSFPFSNRAETGINCN